MKHTQKAQLTMGDHTYTSPPHRHNARTYLVRGPELGFQFLLTFLERVPLQNAHSCTQYKRIHFLSFTLHTNITIGYNILGKPRCEGRVVVVLQDTTLVSLVCNVQSKLLLCFILSNYPGTCDKCVIFHKNIHCLPSTCIRIFIVYLCKLHS